MKFKFKRNKKTGEVIVPYANIKDVETFRHYLISSIFGKYPDDITIIIDTTRRKSGIKFDQIEKYLDDKNVEYKAYKIDGAPDSILGLSLGNLQKKKRATERIYLLSITKSGFDKELLNDLLYGFDLAIGLNKKVDYEELCEEVRMYGIENVLFNDEFFEQSIYDSPIATQLRTYIDVTEFSVK